MTILLNETHDAERKAGGHASLTTDDVVQMLLELRALAQLGVVRDAAC